MEFNPDEYIKNTLVNSPTKESFNVDNYLSKTPVSQPQFNPLEYIKSIFTTPDKLELTSTGNQILPSKQEFLTSPQAEAGLAYMERLEKGLPINLPINILTGKTPSDWVSKLMGETEQQIGQEKVLKQQRELKHPIATAAADLTAMMFELATTGKVINPMLAPIAPYIADMPLLMSPQARKLIEIGTGKSLNGIANLAVTYGTQELAKQRTAPGGQVDVNKVMSATGQGARFGLLLAPLGYMPSKFMRIPSAGIIGAIDTAINTLLAKGKLTEQDLIPITTSALVLMGFETLGADKVDEMYKEAMDRSWNEAGLSRAEIARRDMMMKVAQEKLLEIKKNNPNMTPREEWAWRQEWNMTMAGYRNKMFNPVTQAVVQQVGQDTRYAAIQGDNPTLQTINSKYFATEVPEVGQLGVETKLPSIPIITPTSMGELPTSVLGMAGEKTNQFFSQIPQQLKLKQKPTATIPAEKQVEFENKRGAILNDYVNKKVDLAQKKQGILEAEKFLQEQKVKKLSDRPLLVRFLDEKKLKEDFRLENQRTKETFSTQLKQLRIEALSKIKTLQSEYSTDTLARHARNVVDILTDNDGEVAKQLLLKEYPMLEVFDKNPQKQPKGSLFNKGESFDTHTDLDHVIRNQQVALHIGKQLGLSQKEMVQKQEYALNRVIEDFEKLADTEAKKNIVKDFKEKVLQVQAEDIASQLVNEMNNSVLGRGGRNRKEVKYPNLLQRIVGTVRVGLNKVRYNLMRLENIARNFDDTEYGAIEKFFVIPLQNQRLESWHKQQEAGKRISVLLEQYKLNIKQMMTKQLDISGVRITSFERMLVSLIAGQEGGRESLMEAGQELRSRHNKTYVFTQQELDAVLSSVTPQEQSIAREAQSYFQDRFTEFSSTYKLRTGKELPQIKNYFPWSRDVEYKSYTDGAEQMLLSGKLSKYAPVPSAAKERTGTYTYPTRGDFLSNFVRASSMIEDYIALGSIELRLKRVYDSKIFREGVIRNYGEGAYQQFKFNLDDAFNPSYHKMMTDIENFTREMTDRSVTAVILGHIPVALQQWASLPDIVGWAGLRNTLQGLVEYYRNPVKAEKFALENSKIIAFRRGQLDAEVNKITDAIQNKPWYVEWLGNIFLWNDDRVISISWTIGYIQSKNDSKGILNEETHNKAVDLADSYIRRTQPMPAPEDRYGLSKGGLWQKMLTVLSQQLNAKWNEVDTEIIAAYRAKKINTLQALHRIIWMVIVSGLVADLAMTGGNTFKQGWKAFWRIITQPIQGIPFVREILNSAIQGQEFKGSLPYRALQEITFIPGDVERGKVGDALSKGLSAVGLTLGLPIPALTKTLGGISDLYTGKTHDVRRLIWSKSALGENTKGQNVSPVYKPLKLHTTHKIRKFR